MKDETKYIEAAWQSYKDARVPKTACVTQVNETRKAFYAGASVLFYRVTNFEEDTVAEAHAKMNALDSEILSFVAESCCKHIRPKDLH